MNNFLWTPSPQKVKNACITAFQTHFEHKTAQQFHDYKSFHRYTVEHRDIFWAEVWDWFDVIGEKGQIILEDTPANRPLSDARFFPDAKLNFAENLLRRCDDAEAIVFNGEDRIEARLTWAGLTQEVSRLQQWMQDQGIVAGTRVAAMMPNMPETIIAMLAATSLGATWCSCSPDFGVSGVLDRFGQIEPELLIVCDGYYYGGKTIDILGKIQEIAKNLPCLKNILVVNYAGNSETLVSILPKVTLWNEILSVYTPKELYFEKLPFDHPLYIMFSSGTTGIPKCIVHGAGGTLLQHLKEHQLHCDIKPDDRVFYFTTCGWMMWNWLASVLASQATLVLYDGSPFYPKPSAMFDLAQREKVTLFGTSAKFLDACHKEGLKPSQTHNLGSMRLMTSTGSPLSRESFHYVYDSIKSDVQLVSMSGGTDILSCFVLGNPTLPVWEGEIQVAGLGLAVDIYDENGKTLATGKGELVCTQAFPCMPIGFWNDDGSKYKAAYFERFAGMGDHDIWCHGDFAEWGEHGGLIIHGRSDATLNPGGVRIGTAEIYAQVEAIPEVIEALAIGQEWDNDVRVVLFVRLKPDTALDDALVKVIKTRIREGASPRHVPAKIIPVADIPRTKSGKITELAVRDIVHGRPVKNQDALANPEALRLYENVEELKT